MQRLEVSGAVRPLYGSLGVKGLNKYFNIWWEYWRDYLLTYCPYLHL